MPGRTHAAGQIQGRTVAAHALHEPFQGLGLPHIRLGFVEGLGAQQIAGAAPRQNQAVLGDNRGGGLRLRGGRSLTAHKGSEIRRTVRCRGA